MCAHTQKLVPLARVVSSLHLHATCCCTHRPLPPDITEQPPRPDVVPSVLERNALVTIEAQERAAEQRAAGIGKNINVRNPHCITLRLFIQARLTHRDQEVRKQRKAALMGTASEAFREALNAKGDRSLNEGAEKRRLENLVRTRPLS